jgi:cytochrome P450
MSARSSVAAGGVGSLRDVDGVEPWDFYERVRALGDVVWDDAMNAWLVTSYQLLKEMSRDGTTWESQGGGYRAVEVPGMTSADWLDFMAYGSTRTLTASRGEDHDRQHRWWMRTFSGKTVRHLGETLVRPVAHAQLDRIALRGRAELYEEFANRVAPRVIAAAMGLPWQDDDWITHVLGLHVRRIALIGRMFDADRDDASDAAVVASGRAAVRELAEIVRPYVLARRSGEGDDFISLVWRDAAHLYGPDYDETDVIATINVAFAGGSGTTAATTSAALHHLMEHPELQDELRSHAAAIPLFVEEILRLYGPTPYRQRTAAADSDLGGAAIRRGDQVIGLAHAANRDPAHYGSPFAVDLDRSAPRDHFSFGLHGPRTCPGQGLARTQLTTIFSVVTERLRDLRLDPEAEPPRYTDSFVRRWRPLHAFFESV